MFQWIEKFQTHQDSINFLIVSVFFLYLYTMKYNDQLSLLFSPFALQRLLRKSVIEKKSDPLYFSNLILTFLSLMSFSFLIFFAIEKLEILNLKEISFFKVFGVLTSVVVFRYLILHFIFRISGHSILLQLTAFKSIVLYGVIGAYGVFFFSIYYFGFYHQDNLFRTFLMLLIISVLFAHINIYLKIIKSNSSYSIYLILYLCAFKLAPWILIYFRLD